MQILLKEVKNPRKEGKWGKLDIVYVKDGKESKRTLVAIGNTKDVMNAFREPGAVGSVFEIGLTTTEKDGQTYYNWDSAKKVEGSAAKETKSSYTSKSTYETPEERALKNISICRQNALTNAVVFLSAKEGKATPEDVISLATVFAAFTAEPYAIPEAPKPVAAPAPEVPEELEDDIPF